MYQLQLNECQTNHLYLHDVFVDFILNKFSNDLVATEDDKI